MLRRTVPDVVTTLFRSSSWRMSGSFDVCRDEGGEGDTLRRLLFPLLLLLLLLLLPLLWPLLRSPALMVEEYEAVEWWWCCG